MGGSVPEDLSGRVNASGKIRSLVRTPSRHVVELALPALKYVLPHGKIITKTRSVGIINSNQRWAGGSKSRPVLQYFLSEWPFPISGLASAYV